MKLKVTFYAIAISILLLSGCGGSDGGGGSSEPGDTDNTSVSIEGAAVKGPLAGAVVNVYEVDLSADDLKGSLLDEGSTGSDAAIDGLEIDEGLSGLLLLEFVVDDDTVEVNTGEAPVFESLVTVCDVQRIYDGDAIYASPLTTMAVSLAQRKADTGSPYAGNDDDVISESEFVAALEIAQNQVKSTLGFGLDTAVDIFTVPPLITSETDTVEEQTDVAAYRQAIEALAAVAEQVANDSVADDSAQDIVDALVEDLSDGVIDGESDEGPIDALTGLDDDIDTILTTVDLATLLIPGTDRPVTDVESELVDEMAATGEEVDTGALEDDTIEVDLEQPEVIVDIDGDGVGDNIDAFPNDPTETVDSDGDGVGDNGDAFPNDSTEWLDSDNDGVGDNADAFPNDATETVDSDNDGVGDNSDVFPNDSTEWLDSDNDGVGDNGDAFPNDATETVDSDNDGVGDNSDVFPNDSTEWLDSDNDSVGDNSDAFPNDPTQSVLYASDLTAEANFKSVSLTWDDTGATTYNLYYATAPDCDVTDYAACPDGTVLSDVTSPYTVGDLTNGRNYWFQVESVANNSTVTSNEVGARPDQLVTNGPVLAITHDANGVTYLGGSFTRVGVHTGYGVPVDVTTGDSGAYPLVGGVVNVAISDGAGGYYIGGDFTNVDGQTRNRLAHILANGTLDAWDPDANGSVYALLLSGNTVYVGGEFTAIDGEARNYLAAIGTDGTLGSWDPDAGGSVYALAGDGDTVYVGGSFGTVGGEARGNLAAIGTDGVLSTTWTPSTNNTVVALAVSDNVVYAGGGFYQVDGQQHNKIAAIGTDGTLSSWDPVLNDNLGGQVNAIAISGTTIYIGGTFMSIGAGNEARNGLAAVDADGTIGSWAPLFNNLGVNVLEVSGDTVYVGGGLPGDSYTFDFLAAYDTDGTQISWSPDPKGNVYALAVSGSTLYVGGEFTMLSGQTRNRLAAINADGTLNTTWDPNADSYVDALAIDGTTVYVGGDFTTIGGETHNYLTAIDTDGTLDAAWQPDANDSVHALAVADGTVYVGGAFTMIDSTVRNYVAAIGTNGVLDTTWNPGADDEVDAIAVDGSTVYAGGWFTIFGGSPRTSLAAIGTDGVLTSWSPSADAPYYFYPQKMVSSIVVSGSTVYVGGGFSWIDDGQGGGEQTRECLAAIGTDGVLSDWAPDALGDVYTLVMSGSTIYAGGAFNSIGDGVARNHLAAINTDGTIDSWDPNVSGTVYTLDISNGSLNVGGDFSTVGGELSPNYSIVAP